MYIFTPLTHAQVYGSGRALFQLPILHSTEGTQNLSQSFAYSYI